jgi:hypothetical protein
MAVVIRLAELAAQVRGRPIARAEAGRNARCARNSSKRLTWLYDLEDAEGEDTLATAACRLAHSSGHESGPG